MGKKRIKQYLMLLMVVGVVSIAAGGNGTFASFNAETQNNNNVFATGTLLLHNTANGATTCASESSSTNVNVTEPTGCTTLFSNVSLGSPASGTLNTAITAGTITSFIADLGSGATLQPGDQVTVTDGVTPTTFTVSRTASPGAAVTIHVLSQSSPAYSSGATVNVLTYTSYATLALQNAGTLNAQDIKFSFPGSGCTNSANQTLTLGTADVSNGAIVSITLSSGAAYGAPNGATLKIGTDSVTLGQQLNPGTTTFTVSGTISGGPYTGQAVTYTPFISGPGTLCSSLRYSIVETATGSFNHDDQNAAAGCAHGQNSTGGIGCAFSGSYIVGSPTTLTGLSIGTALNSNNANELDAGDTRYFVIGVSTDVSSLTNADQNQQATFAMRWHIDQK